jgi:hypothetical protein
MELILKKMKKNQLVQFYDQYLETYLNIFYEKLIVKNDSSGKRIPIDVTSIISNIKNKLIYEKFKNGTKKIYMEILKLVNHNKI